ncbi:hypothetical protein MKEN_00760800 [Mycena kentingensis (nom. inval.)]|nr:hypothetical protein MKEN_00760800 [Mycena kentingensis (nom. inval.)]
MLPLVTDFERWALFSDSARDQPQSNPAESRTQRAFLLSELQNATQRRQAALALERVQLGAQVQAIALQRETATAGAAEELENIRLAQPAPPVLQQPASEQLQTKKELPKQPHPQAASNRPQRQTTQPAPTAQMSANTAGSGQQWTLEQRVEQRAQRALAADAQKRKERERRREQEAQRRRQRDREQENQNASTTPSTGSGPTTPTRDRWAAFREWSAAFSKFNSPKTPRPTNTDNFSAFPWPVFVFRDPPTVRPDDVVAENVRAFLIYAGTTFKSTNEMEEMLEQIVSLGSRADRSPSVKRATEAVTTAVAKYKKEFMNKEQIMAESTRARLYDYNARYSSA